MIVSYDNYKNITELLNHVKIFILASNEDGEKHFPLENVGTIIINKRNNEGTFSVVIPSKGDESRLFDIPKQILNSPTLYPTEALAYIKDNLNN